MYTDLLNLQKLCKILSNPENKNLREVCAKVKQLKSLGKSDEEIEAIVKSLNLPLKHHLFVLGNFSNLIRLNYE